MKKLKNFTIQFVGLKIGRHQYDYQIDDQFFEHFEYDDFNHVDVKVDLELEKKANMLDLRFTIKGLVNINCDVTNEPFDLPIKNSLELVVKFGDEFNDENEELLILPHGEYELEVQQYIYEAIVLAIPYKRVHPGVEDGSLQSEVLNKLEELQPKQKEIKEEEDEIDPRWNKLKNLLNDNK
ncbi:Uncharacterized metal-binding protein YceD, DUF177 family [Mesonia phycicola]|uniref:Uncharacterized metal-binding protein YceD, DUF177 family n=1 Tax=Mesonia phycicola TaxID=579105 RepID=A0A1M6D753_9FLAO|nr:DUF177 domain-containing protein [Mesonia phycicola]SHI68818.1 Uncharacterized metal-binding protein YceD, DUF177 family [Mesonia phycicola]